MELIQPIVPPLLRHAGETEIYSLVLKLNSGTRRKKARSWRALSGSGTSAGHPGVSQMAQGGTEQKGAKTAVSIFHQDAEAREQVASMHQDRS